MKKTEIVERAKQLHGFMLKSKNPHIMMKRFGLCLDLVTISRKGSSPIASGIDRANAFVRINKFVERNAKFEVGG